MYPCCTIKKLLFNKRFVKFVWRNCTNYTVGGRGGENERTVGVKLVRLVTISNYRRKVRTLYLSLFYVRQVHELSNWGKVSSDNFCRLSFTVSLNSSHLSVEILTWFPVSDFWMVSLKGRRDALEKKFSRKKNYHSQAPPINLYKSIYFGTFVNISYNAITKCIQNHEPQSSVMNICWVFSRQLTKYCLITIYTWCRFLYNVLLNTF